MGAMAATARRRRFNVDEYRRMAEAGILREELTELVDGEILRMSPIGSRHGARVARLNHRFVQAVGNRAVVWVQGPLRLGRFTEVQPDLVLLTPRADFYASRVPGPGDVLLVVEVAETSERYDRAVKLPLYARAGVPEAWLVRGRTLEIRRKPSAKGYRDVLSLREGDVSPLVFPEACLPLAFLLA